MLKGECTFILPPLFNLNKKKKIPSEDQQYSFLTKYVNYH